MQLAKLLPLIGLLFACEQRTNFALRTSLDGEFVQVDTLTLLKSTNETIRTYIIDEAELVYNIDFSNPNQSTLSLNSESLSFNFSDTVTIYLNNQKITVYRFNSNFEAIDGELFHFFTKEHGLLMIRNPTWGNSTIVQLWSLPVLERLSMFRNNSAEPTDSETQILDNLEIETTENER